ncbi:hypothetical protein ACLKA6_006968 [Drosophila palustris]
MDVRLLFGLGAWLLINTGSHVLGNSGSGFLQQASSGQWIDPFDDYPDLEHTLQEFTVHEYLIRDSTHHNHKQTITVPIFPDMEHTLQFTDLEHPVQNYTDLEHSFQLFTVQEHLIRDSTHHNQKQNHRRDLNVILKNALWGNIVIVPYS